MTVEGVRRIDVFFYGLFMDEVLLREKGVVPEGRRVASVADFRLSVGDRATLIPRAGEIAYGVVFSLTHEEIGKLYSDASVSAYRPEAVAVRLRDGDTLPALCFNLPRPPLAEERNPEYASKLRALAARLGLPHDYVSSIN
jgi:hypothetical protein